MTGAISEILLIDDSPDDCALFSRAVQESRLEARVTAVNDVAQAVVRLNRLGKYANEPLPALIVLDLDLTGLHGKTFLEIIRKVYAQDFVPVVIMTGSIRDIDRAECESLGCSAYIVKPRTYGDLVHIVSGLDRFLPLHPPAEKLKGDTLETGVEKPMDAHQ